MKTLSKLIKNAEKLISQNSVKSISFDIDGTLYPMSKIKNKSFQSFKKSPLKFILFLLLRKKFEVKRYIFNNLEISEKSRVFFENYFTQHFLDEEWIEVELRNWIVKLKNQGLQIYFISDHGTDLKLKKLKLSDIGMEINCLKDTSQLKPHQKISEILKEKFKLTASNHLHLGDRSCDQELAQSIGCLFMNFDLDQGMQKSFPFYFKFFFRKKI